MKYYYISIFALLILFGCEEIVVVDSLDRAIVQAYLYADSPVDDIRLTQPLPFQVPEDSTAPPINDAQVFITHNGERYELALSAGDSGYYHYIGDKLEIKEGETYGLEFEHRGTLVSAVTQVPTSPKNLNISHQEVTVAPITSPMQAQSLQSIPPFELEWDLEQEAFFYALVENMTEDPEDIIQIQTNGNGPRPGGGRVRQRFRLISEPFEESTYSVPIQTVLQYGDYMAIVYRVNQEYVDLYQSLDQDSRDLNEPLNNINNGLGVFAAFNSDTVFFSVKKP